MQEANGNPFTNEVFYANRGQMETCASTNYTYYTGLTNADGSGISFTIAPAVEHTYPGNTEYMVDTNGPGGGCSVTLWWLNSDTSLFNFNVPTQCYSPPPPAAQLGSAGTLETLDNRLYQASFQNGLLSFDTAGSYDWGDGNGPVGIVIWFQLNASSATVANQGNFGIPSYWLFFPAMEVNSKGHMLFMFDSSGPTIYPSIWAVSGCFCDTISVANGNSYYGTSGTSRWGDYQSAWRDPKSPKLIWVTGQYGAATNSWGTWADDLLPA